MFYRWLNGAQEPSIVKWINISFTDKNQKLLEKIITENEVKLMIGSAEDKRDKAMIALLWDIVAKISEIENPRVKYIKFDDVGISILVNSKKWSRKVRAESLFSNLTCDPTQRLRRKPYYSKSKNM